MPDAHTLKVTFQPPGLAEDSVTADITIQGDTLTSDVRGGREPVHTVLRRVRN
jgi:hypothetical protein